MIIDYNKLRQIILVGLDTHTHTHKNKKNKKKKKKLSGWLFKNINHHLFFFTTSLRTNPHGKPMYS